MNEGLRISVIIPTYRRPVPLNLVLAALAQQTLPAYEFEVVVVMDGADAATQRLLEESSFPFSLRWFVQPRRGVTAARNFGIRRAEASTLLFLDDDIIASPQLLARHHACHQAGTNLVVLGSLKLHPASPERFLGEISDFARPVLERCLRPGYEPNHLDFLDGNHSVRKEFVLQVGGWDESLKGFGGLCDTEIGLRFEQLGLRFVFEPEALAYHYYVKPLDQALEDMRYAGRAQLWYFCKYPDRLCDLRFPIIASGPWWKRGLFRLARLAPEPLFSLLSKQLATRIRGWQPQRAIKLAELGIRFLRGFFFCRGCWDEDEEMERASRQLRLRVPILAYHRLVLRAESDSGLSVSVEEFARQLKCLAKEGYQSVSLQDLVEWQTSLRPLPSRPIVITFDGGCKGLRELAVPHLSRYGFRATVFLVAGKIGDVVDWEDAAPLAVMDPDEVRDLTQMGFDMGIYCTSHSDRTTETEEKLGEELEKAAHTVERITGHPARFVAYSSGRGTPGIHDVIRRSGFQGACAREGGLNNLTQDRFLLRRICVPRTKGAWRLRFALRGF